MIYTVTFNPAIDYVVRLDAPLEVGEVNRAKGEDCVLGGKGINVSGVLAQLGCESVALGFVAGETGAWLERGLAAQGLKTDFVHLEQGMTRINVKIKAGQETELNGAGPDIPESAMQELEKKLDSLNEDDILILAGSIPASLSQDTYERLLARLQGRGVRAVVDGRTVCVGNDKLMEEVGVAWHPCHRVGTTVHVAVDGTYAGHLVISDEVKPDAARAIEALRREGVRRTVMLTGDAKAVGESVAKELGVDEVHAELLPADKVDQVEALLTQKSPKGTLAFVGDGINDAPVLSRADIGIAMGGLGSDAAIEAADIVLMDDDPAKISLAMRISRKCMRIAYENIVFALAVKAVCLVLTALGITNMWWGVFADVGVMVLALRKKFGGAVVTRAKLLMDDAEKPKALGAAKNKD